MHLAMIECSWEWLSALGNGYILLTIDNIILLVSSQVMSYPITKISIFESVWLSNKTEQVSFCGGYMLCIS